MGHTMWFSQSTDWGSRCFCYVTCYRTSIIDDDDDYNLFDDKLTARIPKISISLSDNITNHLDTQK